ncbi:MAG: hypothetical protein ACKVWV_11410 [Planctomycetota bacterium]
MTSRSAQSVAVVLALLAARAAANDRLLVSGYNSDNVARFDATSAAFVDALASGGQDGILGTCIGPDGALYVCSENSDAVKRFDASSGAYLGDFIANDPATPEDETGGLDGPAGLVFGTSGRAFVASFNNDSIREYDARSGRFLRVLVATGAGTLNGPDAGLAIGPDGVLYVPAYFSNRVKRYSLVDGAFLGDWITPTAGLSRPRTIVFRGAFAYVTSEGNDRVLECDAATGALVRTIVWNDPATPADDTGGLDGPTGLAFGPDGRMYVASIQTDAVLRYDTTSGAFVDVFVASGAGGIAGPTFLAFQPDARNYGPHTPNSAGRGAAIVARGFSSVAAHTLELDVHFAPLSELVLFFYGTGNTQAPFGDGNLLVPRASVRRLGATSTDAFGHARHPLDFAALASSPLPLAPGTTRSFQALLRDPNGPGGSGANLTDAVEVRFSP